jgi:hypothetical protein
MATVTKAKAHDKWLADRKARELENTLRLISENLEYVADGLTAASNNWSDDYNYGHLTDKEVKMFEAWRQLINKIRN